MKKKILTTLLLMLTISVFPFAPVLAEETPHEKFLFM
jgi:hypothetical protein